MIQKAKRFDTIADPTVMNLLKLTQKPDIISFSGGTPAPKTFATQLAKEAIADLDMDLQYSPTSGTPDMREAVATWLSKKWGVEITPDHVLITTGSQQGLDIVARTYVNDGETILVEDPTYFVALYAFSAYEPSYQEYTIEDLPAETDAKLMYVIPTFQNPTGYTLTSEERSEIVAYANKHDVMLIEDDPYGELWFEEEPPKPLYLEAPEKTVYMTSMSKIAGPAFRLGIMVADPEIIESFTRVKQGMDLCTSRWLQDIAAHMFNNPKYADHLAMTRDHYAGQAKKMLSALEEHMPESVSWDEPKGGMFIWLTVDEKIDTQELYEKALEKDVAFVPGYIFRPSMGKSNQLRLAFAIATDEQIEEGVKRLAEVINDYK